MKYESWLTKKEVAAYFGVTTRTIERWHALGLPVYKVGGLNRYRFSELDAWVKAHNST